MSEMEIRQRGTLTTFDQKIQAAQMLAEADMIPAVYKKKPGNLFMAIEMGEALGIHHMVSIQEINIISGRPALSASLMASLARAAGHRVRVYGDAGSATCEIVRSDDPEFTHKATWDEAKARKAGLWGKGHWAKDAATMLKWRATAECVRFACSEVLGGLKYTPEEILEIDGVDVITPATVTRPPERAYGIRANLPQRPAAPPEAAPEPVDVPEDAEGRAEALADVLDRLQAAGVPAAEVDGTVSAWAGAVLGAERSGLAELTGAELDRLAAELEGR